METKKQFKYFTIMQYEAEQDYLRRMHQAGWKFVSVTGFCVYHFEKCEPEDVIYQLDYNQDGIEHKEEYVQMFRDCGWEYLQDYVGYSYFRKPASQMDGMEESIFCDDASRLQMMERVYKGRLVPLLAIFFCLLLPQLVYQLQRGHTVLVCMYTSVTVLYLVLFATLFMQYRKLWKAVHRE